MLVERMDIMQNKRDKIMDAALELFAERGFNATTVPTIALNAEVGAGTIYRYFEHKEALVNAVFQRCVESFSHHLQENYPSDSDIREQFRHLFFKVVGFARDHVYAFSFLESQSNAPYLDSKSIDIFQEMMDFFYQFLEEGKKVNVIRSVPTEALFAIVYGAYVEIAKLLRKKILSESDQLMNSLEACCWDAVRV